MRKREIEKEREGERKKMNECTNDELPLTEIRYSSIKSKCFYSLGIVGALFQERTLSCTINKLD